MVEYGEGKKLMKKQRRGEGSSRKVKKKTRM
jgi:hypothetical protein